MRKVLLGVAFLGFVTSGANGALLFLDSGGGGSMDLAPGGTGDLSIMLTIRPIDSGFAFANVFLNDDDDLAASSEVSVTGLIEGVGTFYDRTSFVLAADISHDINNEYALIMGSGPSGDGSDNWGPGTYTLDTLVITHQGGATSGSVPVTFEGGGRQPQIFNFEFVQYVWGVGFDEIIPNFADPGVGADDNPFNINFVPEPASLALVAFGGLALLRRRR